MGEFLYKEKLVEDMIGDIVVHDNEDDESEIEDDILFGKNPVLIKEFGFPVATHRDSPNNPLKSHTKIKSELVENVSNNLPFANVLDSIEDKLDYSSDYSKTNDDMIKKMTKEELLAAQEQIKSFLSPSTLTFLKSHVKNTPNEKSSMNNTEFKKEYNSINTQNEQKETHLEKVSDNSFTSSKTNSFSSFSENSSSLLFDSVNSTRFSYHGFFL